MRVIEAAARVGKLSLDLLHRAPLGIGGALGLLDLRRGDGVLLLCGVRGGYGGSGGSDEQRADHPQHGRRTASLRQHSRPFQS
ncbi:MAG: hypothetical protein V9G04_01070 [Nocardioides sp.]